MYFRRNHLIEIIHTQVTNSFNIHKYFFTVSRRWVCIIRFSPKLIYTVAKTFVNVNVWRQYNTTVGFYDYSTYLL